MATMLVELTDREARLVCALIDHHREAMVVGFVEGTATWTTQLTVDPELASDVVGTVNSWVAACSAVTRKIHAAEAAALATRRAELGGRTQTEGVPSGNHET